MEASDPERPNGEIEESTAAPEQVFIKPRRNDLEAQTGTTTASASEQAKYHRVLSVSQRPATPSHNQLVPESGPFLGQYTCNLLTQIKLVEHLEKLLRVINSRREVEQQQPPRISAQDNAREETDTIATQNPPVSKTLRKRKVDSQSHKLRSAQRERDSWHKKLEGREQLLSTILDHNDTNSGHTFLCWGRERFCHAIAIPIPDAAEQIATWKKIRQVYYLHRGWWRSYLPLFHVRNINIVELILTGHAKKAESSRTYGNIETFAGIFTSKDTALERTRLSNIVNSYQPQDLPCPYKVSEERIVCGEDCVTTIPELTLPCPETKVHMALEGLRNLDTRSILTIAFNGFGYDGLRSLLEREELLYSHQAILTSLGPGFSPTMKLTLRPEMAFRALHIQESFVLESSSITIPMLVTFVVVVIIVSRLAYGDWSTAWTAVSAIATLAALYFTWTSYLINGGDMR